MRESKKYSKANKLNIFVILLYWYPYSGPHTPMYAGILKELKQKGHDITIITSFPHFRSGAQETWDEYRGKLYEKTKWEDIDLRRTWVFAPVFRKTKFALFFRALNFISFTLSSLLAGILIRKKCDVVLTLSSPPLINGLVGWVVSRFKKGKSVHNIVDIYPDMAQKVGVWDNKVVMWFLKRLESFVYLLSDKIVVLSDNMRLNLLAKNVNSSKIEVIPDFIDIEGVFPKPKDNIFSRKYNLNNKTIVLYAGNIGIPHGVEVLVETAEIMQEYEDILFCIVGRGENKEKIVKLAESKNLDNISFLPRQPENMIPYIWSSADISVVTYKKGLSEYSVPSKLLYIMASQRPVIVTSDEGSDAEKLVNESKCGLNIEPENPQELKKAILYLKQNEEIRNSLSKNGHEFVKKYFDRSTVVQQFEELFCSICEK